MLEFCLGSYLIFAIVAAAFLWSALVLAKRNDKARHGGMPYWIAVTAARQADPNLSGANEVARFETEEEKLDISSSVHPVDV